MATSASTLDLLRAASVAALDAARSAASLDLLRAPSTSMADETLGERMSTCSRDSRGSTKDRWTCSNKIYELITLYRLNNFYCISLEGK